MQKIGFNVKDKKGTSPRGHQDFTEWRSLQAETEKDVRTRRTADTWKGYQAWNKDRTKERP
jgi:hypothetical protein